MSFDIVPLMGHRLSSSRMRGQLVVCNFLNFTVFFITVVGCVLVSVTALDHHTGNMKIRGYDNTDSTGVFNVFLTRAKVLILVSILVDVLLVIGTHRIVRSLLSIHLSSLFM